MIYDLRPELSEDDKKFLANLLGTQQFKKLLTIMEINAIDMALEENDMTMVKVIRTLDSYLKSFITKRV